MKFDVLNRWTGEVQFTAEIDCNENASLRLKMGLAVRWAKANDADLSGADLRDADLRGAVLSGAVLSGADLSGAVLSGAVLSGAVLRDADLSGADLRGADLSGAVLRGADLSGAVLRGAVLSGACPVKIENIHEKVYEAASGEGSLDMGSWHKDGYCGTTHCRAGWVIVLAGNGGRALEWAMGTPAAAAMIYMSSDPTLDRIPNFYTTNANALEDMKRLADAEKAKA